MASIRKIKAGLVKPTDVNSFIGEYGNIFFDVDTGDLRLSDGVTPGGIPLGGGATLTAGGGAVIFRQLSDTPNSYAGAANFFVKVNSTATALEFKEETLFDGDYNSLTNKPTLFSGSYTDLTNKPTLFSGSYTDLTNKPTLFSGSYTDLTDKPTLFSGSYTDLTDKPTPLSVGVVDLNDNVVKNYTTINSLRFDEESGFDIVDLGSGAVKIQMNSTFKTWKSAGEQDLVATGLDVVEFIAGTGIDISLNPSGSPYQTITITNTSTNGGSDLLGVIIDLDIDADGDLILTHVDTFTEENVEIDSLGYFILSDGV